MPVRLAFLVVLVGCQPDPQAEVRERWAADSARYAGIDCGIVPLDEDDECRRVNGVLRRQALDTRARREAFRPVRRDSAEYRRRAQEAFERGDSTEGRVILHQWARDILATHPDG